MSFTTKIKEEVIKLPLSETEKLALLSGFIRNNATWKENTLVLSSENEKIVHFLCQLLDTIEGVTYTTRITDSNNFSKNNLHVIELTSGVETLLALLDFQDEVPPTYLIEGEEESRCYVRGVFLHGGSVNDPKTSRYHLEISLVYPEEAIFVQKILNQFDLNAKLLNRDKGYMIYLKEAEKISDFLKIVGAIQAVLYYENVRIYREQKNQTNRLNNCEQANMDKVVSTAMEQLHYIEVLKENLAVELLDDKTKEALSYREKYPEASLRELSEIISLETSHKISKPGLNHRFRKMKDLAQKFLEEEDT